MHEDNKGKKISGEGMALIKKFEGCKLSAYLCSANVWTIGYGTTYQILEGDKCTQEDADAFLARDLRKFEKAVIKNIDVPLEQNQFDALVSFTYNLGPRNLKESTLRKRINENNFADVPYQIRRWNRAAGEVLDGLVRRRSAEVLLWQGHDWTVV